MVGSEDIRQGDSGRELAPPRWLDRVVCRVRRRCLSRMLIDSETVSRRANVSSAAVSGDSARWATGWAAR
ncbi:hypothetical protein CLD22_24650, partial [Rubrivivax gelatinosus]|nr:hypothetical protein [Rubrivivax gelatinosus]